jgi:ABC-type multidrug transport system permease subunit
MNSMLDKLAAILRRDLLTAIRYRTGFMLTLFGVLTELAAFYYLSRAIGPGFRPEGIDYFPFLLVGTGLYTFFVMSAQAFLHAVQEAQQTGTLEVLMTTATAPAELLILSAISAFAGTLLNLLVYLLAGIALFRAAIHANWLSCLVALSLSLAIALAIGILAATFQVAVQKGSALIWLLGSGLWFLSGTMFPVQSLPRVGDGSHVDGSRRLRTFSASPGSRRPLVQPAPGAPVRNAFALLTSTLSFSGTSLSLLLAPGNPCSTLRVHSPATANCASIVRLDHL